jgi:hypothetical protein
MQKVTEPFYSFMESHIFGKLSVDLSVVTRLWTGRLGVLCCPAEARGLSFPKIGNQSVLLTQYCLGDKMEKAEMGGACGTYGGEEWCDLGFGGDTCGKETTWETQVQMGG